jgi:hypothetical protein
VEVAACQPHPVIAWPLVQGLDRSPTLRSNGDLLSEAGQGQMEHFPASVLNIVPIINTRFYAL